MGISYSDKFKFDSFAVSDCNREAYTLCRSVIDDINGKFVAVYGPSPCGKTHLLNAVKAEYQNKHPTKKVLIISYKDLLSQYIDSIIEREATNAFRKRICCHDLLIIDNMQFANMHTAVQKELAYWFGEMVCYCKSIIVAWDGASSCLDTLIERLSEYPVRPQVVEMREPDFVIREKYFERLAEEAELSIPDDVRNRVVTSQKIPFYAFKGYLIKLKVFQNQKGKRLTKREMLKCLSDYAREYD